MSRASTDRTGRRLRQTGIDAVGSVPWGTHFCHFYETAEDLFEILIPYFKAGLENNEYCLWIVSEPLTEKEALETLRNAVPELEHHLIRGSIEIISRHQWYLKDGAFSPFQVVDAWKGKLRDALARGYEGLRAQGNESWLTEKELRNFLEYEQRLEEALANEQILLLCTYPLTNRKAGDIFDVAEAHEFAIAKRHGHLDVLAPPGAQQTKTELIRLKEELEERVRERTRELAAANENLLKEIAERKRAEEALRESEELYRFLAENTRDLITLYTLEEKRVFVSPSFANIIGKLPEKTFSGVHPEDLPTVRQAWDRMLTGEKTCVTLRHIHEDGSWRWLEAWGSLVHYRGIPHVMAVTRDVTKRKCAEEALRRSQEHLTALIQSVEGIVWEANAETFHLNFVSPWAERLLGYQTSRWINEPSFWYDHLHPDDRERAVQICTLSTRELRDHELEYRMIAVDGSPVWLRDIVTVVTENGRAAKLRGIMVDITAQKLAEARIQRLNRTYAVLSGINELIVRERDSQTIFDKACKIAVDQGGFLLATIGLVEKTSGEIRLVARESRRLETLEDIHGILRSPVTDAVLETGGSRACNDITLDSLVTEWHADALRRGIRSVASFALTVHNRRDFVFSLYADEADFFDTEELRLLNRLSENISFALEVSENEYQRQQAIDQLQASEQRYRALVENAPTGIFINLDGRFAYVNQAFCTLIGARSPEEILNTPVFDRCLPTFHGAIRRRLEETQNTGQPAPLMEQCWIRLDGSLVAVETTTTAVTFHGRPAWQVLVNDITKRRQAEEELRVSEERFRELAETIDDVFWVTDARTRKMLYISPAYEKVWGQPCEDLYGDAHSWLKAIHPDDRARVTQAAIALQTGGSYDEEYRITRPDQQIRWIRNRAFPVRNAGGEIERIVGVARDITAQRQLEEQLRESQKMEAIGQLAGGIAHDFNNILAAIMMQADLATMVEGTPAEVREELLEICASAERAANLTRQLLLFSRRQVMQLHEVDLNDVVTNLAKMLQRVIGEDIRLQLRLHPAPLITRADAGMLDQIILNLAVNARDAMPQGGQLTIATEEKYIVEADVRRNSNIPPGQYLSLKVSDTGAGISSEVLPRIFEPFFTTKESGKGTGLGLATVYGIVKQHRGWIEVASQPGQGTVFQIHLPASDSAMVGNSRAVRPKPRGGTETILLVEDDTRVRLVTRVVLEKSGYRVVEAANGIEALKIWEDYSGTIDLLLTDLIMPGGITGQQLAKELRKQMPSLKVIFSSGYSAEIAGRELILHSGENFLQKPYHPDQLIETIRLCLDQRTG